MVEKVKDTEKTYVWVDDNPNVKGSPEADKEERKFARTHATDKLNDPKFRSYLDSVLPEIRRGRYSNVKEVTHLAIRELVTYDEDIDVNYALINQELLAFYLGVSHSSVRRAIEELEEGTQSDVKYKRGVHGGAIITFDPEVANLKSNNNNPVNGKNKKADKLYDKYFLPRGEKPTKGVYRTKEEIERDNLLKSEKEQHIAMVNYKLNHGMIPDKEFFEREYGKHADLAYRALTVAQMYNALLVTYAEDWKNDAEMLQDRHSFEKAEQAERRFRNYNVLGNNWFGSRDFLYLMNLVRAFDQEKIDPYEYLTVQVDFIYWGIRQKGNKFNVTKINQLGNKKNLDRYENNVANKEKVKKEHPYYYNPAKVFINSKSNPITTLLRTEYETGLYDNISNIKEDNFEYINEDLFHIYDVKAFTLINFSRKVLENAKDLSKEDFNILADYLNRNIYLVMEGNQIGYKSLRRLLPFLRITNDVLNRELEKPNADKRNLIRDYLGNFATIEEFSMFKAKKTLKDGYKMYFSLNASRVLTNHIKMINIVKDNDLDIFKLREIINSLDIQIPVNYNGLIDVDQLTEEYEKQNSEFYSERRADLKKFLAIEEAEFHKSLEAKSDEELFMVHWYESLDTPKSPSKRTGEYIYN